MICTVDTCDDFHLLRGYRRESTLRMEDIGGVNLTVNPLIGGVTLQPSRSKTVLGTLDGVSLDLKGNKKHQIMR